MIRKSLVIVLILCLALLLFLFVEKINAQPPFITPIPGDAIDKCYSFDRHEGDYFSNGADRAKLYRYKTSSCICTTGIYTEKVVKK